MSLVTQLSALATRIAEAIVERGLPAGGATGQVLAKLSEADYDAGWAAGEGGTVVGSATSFLVAVAGSSIQSFANDQEPVQIVLATAETDNGGEDLEFHSTSGGYVKILTSDVYMAMGSVNVVSSLRGGDRNTLIMIGSGTTPNPTGGDEVMARSELTSNNSTTKDTGSWVATMRPLYLEAGTIVYLAFAQHARTGSGAATLGVGGDSSQPNPWLAVFRMGGGGGSGSSGVSADAGNLLHLGSDDLPLLEAGDLPGGSGAARASVAVTTASLAVNASASDDVALGMTADVLRVSASAACRVTLWVDAAAQTADGSRPITTAPGSAAGVFLDAYLDGVTPLVLAVPVRVAMFAGASTRARVTNWSPAATAITVTFDVLVLEA